MKMKCYHITKEDGEIINKIPDETWNNLCTDLYNKGVDMGILYGGFGLIVSYFGCRLVDHIIFRHHKS